jgi:two-component system sensor histidine kinase KdpD
MVPAVTPRLHPYVGSAAAVAATGVVAEIFDRFLELHHVTILFLFAVLLSAIRWGLGPSIFAALLSVGCSAFFFYPPIYDFRVASPQDIIDLVVFVAVAALTSRLTADVRRQTIELSRHELTQEALYAFSQRLVGVADGRDLYAAIVEHLAAVVGRPVFLLTRNARQDRTHSGGGASPLPPEVLELADVPWSGGAAAVSGWSLRALRTGRGQVGVIATEGAIPPQDVDLGYFNALLDQAALAIERTTLAAAIEDARVEAKTEVLREALINSISHDLQTPLAAILGSATALQSFGELGDGRARGELLATIREEAERLNAFIGSILDLTRIRAGQVTPRLELVELSDIVDAALRRTQRTLAAHVVTVDLPSDLPMLRLDLFLMEHAIVNLLDNAAKYAPAGSSIRITAVTGGDEVQLEVSDAGEGIPPQDLERVFETFYRGTTDAKPAGTGLGLAIARAFIEASGGRIEAASSVQECGATFRIHLPFSEAEASAGARVADE